MDVSYTVRVWTFWYLSLTFSPVWDNVWGFDYSPMKDIALTEPLVDTVELKAVVSDPCPIITLDLYTVQSSDLAFKAPFSLPAKRNDFVHALIAWFDIDFTACHKPISFSTGPHARYTHWKQTVFYLRDVLTMEEGEVLTGVIENKPNDKNKRDLDIGINYKFETTDPVRYAENGCFFRMYVLYLVCYPRIRKLTYTGVKFLSSISRSANLFR